MTPPAPPARSAIQRLLAPIVELRSDEAVAVLLMFSQSFLAMSAYNIVKPLTRAQFIQELGADNLPFVLVVSGVLVGFVMQLYSRAVSRLPPQAVQAATLIGVGLLLIVFWGLFRADTPGASVLFYFSGQILGVLLISQFWTLANDIYDARQAKRLFGFIGGGASLGGITASALVAFTVGQVGTNNLLLVSAAMLFVGAGVVSAVLRQTPGATLTVSGGDESGVGGREAIRLLRESRHLQLIALVIGFAAIGAGLLDQQLNMAVEEAAGAGGADSIAAFLGQVQLYLSLAGFVVQVWLTSRIHRYLGIGFAILILPIGLGATGGLILVTGALWAAAAGRVVDAGLRYTVDKTTREILFLPLPVDLRRRAKPFVDVTVDRFAKGIGAALTLVLIQPWGLGLSWHQLSWVSLTITAFWIVGAVKAHRQYLSTFRASIARGRVRPAEARLSTADLSTVEALVEELAHPDERRVLYAIDLLESFDKQHLITPLLLRHPSSRVRARVLGAIDAIRPDVAGLWAPEIERLIADPEPETRTAAIGALVGLRHEDALANARILIRDDNPHIVATAAVILSKSNDEADRRVVERTLALFTRDTSPESAGVRRDLAAAAGRAATPRARDLLILLLDDPHPQVAEEAMRSIRALDEPDSLFVPRLVSLLGHRQLKNSARDTLVGYGEPVIDVLRYCLENPAEDRWVRRHIPATLARIPNQASMDILVATLRTDDRFLRFKAIAAIEKLHRDHPDLTVAREPIEQVALDEGSVYYSRLGSYYNLFVRGRLPTDTILARELSEKLDSSVDRVYRLLSLLHAWKDIAAARWALAYGDARARAGAAEYLDNVLSGKLRTWLIPVLEDMPIVDRVRRADALLKSRPRGVDATLRALTADRDPVVAAAAVDLIGAHGAQTLEVDLERLAASHDVDRIVTDAAAWRLASRGGSRTDRAWTGALPAVALVDRLRKLPLFASVSVDELFRIAAAGRQVEHAADACLVEAGRKPDGLQVLLEGAATASGEGAPREIAAPAAPGFEEALMGSRMAETIRTSGRAVTLVVDDDELRTLLADDTELVRGLFRTLAELTRASSRLDRARGEFRTLVNLAGTRASLPYPRRGTGPDLGQADDPLGPSPDDDLEMTAVEKGMALRRIPLFAKVTGAEMLHVAAIAERVRLAADESFSDAGSRPSLAMVLAGELELRTTSGATTPARALPGDVVGMHETLAGAKQVFLVATMSSVVLKIDREELFDVLGQRPDLLRQVFGAILDH